MALDATAGSDGSADPLPLADRLGLDAVGAVVEADSEAPAPGPEASRNSSGGGPPYLTRGSHPDAVAEATMAESVSAPSTHAPARADIEPARKERRGLRGSLMQRLPSCFLSPTGSKVQPRTPSQKARLCGGAARLSDSTKAGPVGRGGTLPLTALDVALGTRGTA